MKYTYTKIYMPRHQGLVPMDWLFVDIKQQRRDDYEWLREQFGEPGQCWSGGDFVGLSLRQVEWSFAHQEDLVLFKLSRC